MIRSNLLACISQQAAFTLLLGCGSLWGLASPTFASGGDGPGEHQGEPDGRGDPEGNSADAGHAEMAVDNDAVLPDNGSHGQYGRLPDNGSHGQNDRVSPDGEPVYGEIPPGTQNSGNQYDKIPTELSEHQEPIIVVEGSPTSDEPYRQLYFNESTWASEWREPGDCPLGYCPAMLDRTTNEVYPGSPPVQHQQSLAAPQDLDGAEFAGGNPHNIYSSVGLPFGGDSSSGDRSSYDSASGLKYPDNPYDDAPPAKGADAAQDDANDDRAPSVRNNPKHHARKYDSSLQEDLANMAIVEAVLLRRQPAPGGKNGWTIQR